MTYLTVSGQAEAEIVVSRSRFRCLLVRVDDELSARGVIEQARREHWDARHHCSAYVLGPDRGTERSSDDGEPPGTGGAPMLEVLRGRELSDVVAVVTRWFGGTLLGTRGAGPGGPRGGPPAPGGGAPLPPGRAGAGRGDPGP